MLFHFSDEFALPEPPGLERFHERGLKEPEHVVELRVRAVGADAE
jgi:hypothetical protein